MTDSNKPSRRGWRATLIAAGLVAIGGAAIAIAHPGGWHHGPGMEAEFEHHQEHLQAMLTKIGATDAQKAQIDGLMKPAFDEMKAFHDAHSSAFGQFHEALLAPSVDRAKLEELRAAQIHAL